MATVLFWAAASPAWAWAETGHRIIGQLAVEALPAEIPAFLRGPDVAADVGELSREPDRWRNSGKLHDTERDPAHFLDVDDQGLVLGGPALAALPVTRGEYEAALRAVGTDVANAGYLPYAIIDGWQQLAKDFAYWRALTAAERREPDRGRRDWLHRDRLRRERLILRDLGVWAHYVGDGGQPLHVSVHYNGWGAHPNPQSYTQARVHAVFEGDLVRRDVRDPAVRARMTALSPCACPIEARTTRYLLASWRLTGALYESEKAAGFRGTDPRATTLVTERLAAGASELRDMTVDAWRASAYMSVGYPQLRVRDIEAGRIAPYDSLFGKD